MLRIKAILFEYDKDDVLQHPKHTGHRVDQIVHSIMHEYPDETRGTHTIVRTMEDSVEPNRKLLVEFESD
jgi:hypothetical protein